MKSHRAAWKDRREFRAATAWWKVNSNKIADADAKTGVTPEKRRSHVIKLNAIMSPRTDTLLKLFEREVRANVQARKAQVARNWTNTLKAAGPVKNPVKRKITPREV